MTSSWVMLFSTGMIKLLISFFFIIGYGFASFAEDVTYTSKDGYVLRGTLNVTSSSKRAVLFLHGSGNLDRNETLPASYSLDGQPVELFKTLSNELLPLSVSSLRYDKRGFKEIGTPLADEAWRSAIYENLLADAEAGISLLISRGFTSIILVGHSEGTNLAIDLCTKSLNKKSIESLVLIGVVGRSMLDSFHYQTVERTVTNVYKSLDPGNKGYITDEDVPLSMKKSLPVPALDSNKNGRLEPGELLVVLEQQNKQFVATVMADKTHQVVGGFPTLWWQHAFTEPTNITKAASIDKPVFILHGMQDQQVTYQEDALPFYNALKSARKTVVLKSYPTYGHGLSPDRADGSSTLGPIQADALSDFRNIF